MKQSRRQFLTTTAATAGVVTLLALFRNKRSHGGNMFPVSGGEVKVHPSKPRSFVMEEHSRRDLLRSVGDVANYSDLPRPI